jgi:hypothetical protein
MKILLVYLSSVILFVSCSSPAPEEPAIKGVFVGSKTIPATFSENEVVVTMIDETNSSAGGGITYCRYAEGTEIEVDNKRYRFYIDKVGSKNYGVKFWLKERDSYSVWYWTKRYQSRQTVTFRDFGLDPRGSFDSIPPRLIGFCDDIDARIFLALVSSPDLIVKPCYLKFMESYLKQDSAYSRNNGFVLNFFLAHYDPYSQKLLFEDSLLTRQAREKKLLEIGTKVGNIYKEMAYKKAERYYPGASRKSTDLYVSEFTIEPGDSVWFTGRISGDSVIAFLK